MGMAKYLEDNIEMFEERKRYPIFSQSESYTGHTCNKSNNPFAANVYRVNERGEIL